MQKYLNRVVVLLICTYPLFYLGIGARFPWTMLGKNGIGIGMASFFGATSLFFVSTLAFKLDELPHTTLKKCFTFNLILAAIFNLLYDFIQYKHFLSFGYHNPHLLYLIDFGWLIALIYLSIFRRTIKPLFFYAIIFILFHYAGSIYYFPANPLRSDMLIDIQGALQQFLAGVNPYHKAYPMLNVPQYLPLTILSFLPAFLLKFDYRILALVYWAVSLSLLYRKLKNNRKYRAVMPILLIILNPYWLMRHDLYYYFFLLEIVVIYLYLPNMTEFWRIILLGLTIATLQFAWVLMPFILLANSRNLTQLIRQFSCSSLLAMALISVFVRGHFNDLFQIIHLKGYLAAYNQDITFSFATIFYFAANQKILYASQIIGCTLILLYCLYQYLIKKERTVSFYNASGAVCFGYFIITNYYIETYLLMPMLLVLALVNWMNTSLPLKN